MNHSYRCNHSETFRFEKSTDNGNVPSNETVNVTFSNVRWEAFRNVSTELFSSPQDCEVSSKRKEDIGDKDSLVNSNNGNTVAITSIISVISVIVIALIGFFIWSRRTQGRATLCTCVQ